MKKPSHLFVSLNPEYPLSRQIPSDVIVYIFAHYYTSLPVENIAVYTNNVQIWKSWLIWAVYAIGLKFSDFIKIVMLVQCLEILKIYLLYQIMSFICLWGKLCKQGFAYPRVPLVKRMTNRFSCFFFSSYSRGGGGHLGIFWVGMCRPGHQIGTPF